MRKLIVPAVLVMAVALTSSASAATWGGEVYGEFNTHTMEQWNDNIDAANESGAEIENINNGFTGGLGLRMWATPSWMFTAGWEPLFVSTEDEVSGDKMNLDANAIVVSGNYFFPSNSSAKYGIGAGVGYYMIGGEAEDGTSGLTTEVSGSTVGFHFMGLAEWTVSPGFAITGGAGYRIANVGDTQFDETSTDPETETDYSGFMARAGLAFYMPSK
jgi:hypothetical protein